jgi:DNA invertase Pin-like site-specific DNA recombinase
MLLQQMTEADGGLIRRRGCAKIDPDEPLQHRRLVQRLFHPRVHLLLSVIGAVAQFERDLIRERQREGIALAKQRKVYLGRAPSLSAAQADDLRRRVRGGEGKALLAREFGISRTTVYEYLGREVSDASSGQRSRRKRA